MKISLQDVLKWTEEPKNNSKIALIKTIEKPIYKKQLDRNNIVLNVQYPISNFGIIPDDLIGIYMLSSHDGMKYIGKSTDLKNRIKSHLSIIQKDNTKENAKCYQHFKKFGIEQIDFEFLAVYPDISALKSHVLQINEHKFILLYDTVNNGLNASYPLSIK